MARQRNKATDGRDDPRAAWLGTYVERVGHWGASRELGVHRQTIARGLDTGRVEGRLRKAVDAAMARESAADGVNPSAAIPTAVTANVKGGWRDHGDVEAGDGVNPSPAEGGIANDGAGASPSGEYDSEKREETQPTTPRPRRKPTPEEVAAMEARWIDDDTPKTLITVDATPREAERMGVEQAEAVAQWRTARDLHDSLQARREAAGELTKQVWRLELEVATLVAAARRWRLERELIEKWLLTLPPARYPWSPSMRHEQVLARWGEVQDLNVKIAAVEKALKRRRRWEASKARVGDAIRWLMPPVYRRR